MDIEVDLLQYEQKNSNMIIKIDFATLVLIQVNRVSRGTVQPVIAVKNHDIPRFPASSRSPASSASSTSTSWYSGFVGGSGKYSDLFHSYI